MQKKPTKTETYKKTLLAKVITAYDFVCKLLAPHPYILLTLMKSIEYLKRVMSFCFLFCMSDLLSWNHFSILK